MTSSWWADAALPHVAVLEAQQLLAVEAPRPDSCQAPPAERQAGTLPGPRASISCRMISSTFFTVRYPEGDGVDPRGQFADHPRPDHELVTDHLRIRWNLPHRGQEHLGIPHYDFPFSISSLRFPGEEPRQGLPLSLFSRAAVLEQDTEPPPRNADIRLGGLAGPVDDASHDRDPQILFHPANFFSTSSTMGARSISQRPQVDRR